MSVCVLGCLIMYAGMYMLENLYVCMWISVCVCMHVWFQLSVWISTCMPVYVHVRICEYLYSCDCMRLCFSFVWVRRNMCARACLHSPEFGWRKSEYRLCIRETYERAHSLHLRKVKKKWMEQTIHWKVV